MLNKCMFIGHVGADPEIRSTQSGSRIANLRLGVSERWRDRDGNRKEKTEWVSVVVFNEGLVKVVENYVKKGSKLFVEGGMATRKWQDAQGADRYSTEIVIQSFGGQIIMLDGPSDDRGEKPDRSGGDYGTASGGSASRQAAQSPEYDDDIPFAPEWRG